MKLTIRYFGGIRERLSKGSEVLEVEAAEGAAPTVDDLWRALLEARPELLGTRESTRVAVNREFATGETLLSSDDEIALIPPVSGGVDMPQEDAPKKVEPTECADLSGAFLMTDQPLDADAVRAFVTRPSAGAIVVFEGVVRDHTGDREVSYLEYETYLEMARDKLVECADEVVARWETIEIAIHHRWGCLEIGERAVVIAVSSPHRVAAFEACAYTIDRLKEIVPIWKKEVSPDGNEWVGMGA